MDNCVKIRLAPCAFILDFLDILFVRPLENSVASNMVPSFPNIFAHSPQHLFVSHTCGLKKSYEIVGGEVAIWTTMRLANARVGVIEDLLARVGRIPPAPAVGVTTHITVSVSDIVFVSRIELVICEAFERLPPENDTLLEREPNSLQEKCILESAEMLQMVVLA